MPQSFFSFSTHGYKAFFIDYDGDGDLDIVTACSGSHAPIKLHVFDNNNNSFTHFTFGPNDKIGYAQNLEYGDANGDGRMDFFMPWGIGGFVLAIQNADKSFKLEYYPNGSRDGQGHHLFVDVNHDNFDDIIEYQFSKKIVVDYSSGTGILFDQISDNSSSEIKHVVAGYFYGGLMHSHDIDMDSNTDIVFVQSNYSAIDSLIIVFDPFNW